MSNKDILVLVLSILSGYIYGQESQYPTYDGRNSVRVSEGSLVDDEVFNFKVFDPQDDPLTVSINYDKQFKLRKDTPNQYSIILKETLDRETENRYTLVITIDDSNGHVVNKEVRIRVEDVNDYKPIFKNLPLVANIRENQPPGTYILNITTHDEDSGYNSAREIFITDSSQPFYLGDYSTKEAVEHSYSHATVLLSNSLDYESNKIYLVKLNVTDMAGCKTACQTPLSSTQTMIVNVLDEQDMKPYFLGVPYIVTTEENLPIGSPILTVSAKDGDTTLPRQILYYFRNDNDSLVTESELFQIDITTGVVSNRVLIDTDSETLKSHGSLYTLTLVAKEKLEQGDTADLDQISASTDVTISVLDLNDHRPTFSASRVTASVGEELPSGRTVVLQPPLRVVDTDQGINGTFTLHALEEDNSTSSWFQVSPSRVTNKAVLAISTRQKLDYETTPQLRFKIAAVEEQTGYTSYAWITVSVTDANDNSPQFTQIVYNASIAEDASQGDKLLLSNPINATDSDSGSYGTVTYSIQGGHNNKFAIHPVTGTVTLTCDKCLNRETDSSYILNVLAKDGGGLTDTTQLHIYISDVNDNKPEFSKAVYNAYINESSTSVSPSLVVKASDPDLGSNGHVTYTVLNYTDHVGVHSNGTVYVHLPFDAESFGSVLEIIIKASDQGLSPRASYAIIRLHINDINDNSPVFTSPPSTLKIPENTAVADIILTVSATDADKSHPNNAVKFSIISGASDKFSVDPQTGSIRVISPLDKEGITDHYSLVLSATDMGRPSRSSQQIINVTVIDVNDELPEFTHQPYKFHASENSAKDVVAGIVRADDSDLTSFLQYNISQEIGYDSNGNTVAITENLFSIDSHNGTISVAGALDREVISKVILTVIVEDLNGLQAQIATCQVEVEITDINDNAPVIRPVGTLEITESPTVSNIILTRLMVVDNDETSQLEFSISNNPNGAFSIDSRGDLRLIKAVDRETSGNWMNLTVVIQDGVTDALSSSIEIPVFVRDINDNPPRFTQFEAVVTTAEDKPLGANLTQVKATDLDFNIENREIQFRIRSGAQGKVEIDRATGVLKVVGNLDRDADQLTNDSLSIIIEACDRGIPKLCTTKTMTISVTDVNDNNPAFNKQQYNAEISETAQKDDIIRMTGDDQIQAYDIDAAPNGQVLVYSCCSPGNDTEGLFKVNSDGQLAVAAESGLSGQSGIYKITVTASDKGSQPRSGTTTVIINVQDYNDHTPVLTVLNDGRTTIHRPESSPLGSHIVTIKATDGDTGINAQVDFSFITSVPNLDGYRYFKIVPGTNSNVVTIEQNTTFDRESKANQYKFGVVARDRGLPTLSSSTLVITIIVDDVNDNKPYFPADKQRIEVKVREEDEGVAVGSVDFAQDRDERNIFCYYITGARNSEDSLLPAHESIIRRLFTIDPITAEVKIAAGEKLDREKQRKYILVIMADDRDSNVYSACKDPPNTPWVHERSQSNEMELSVIVQDIDDSSPEFSEELFTLAVVRGVPPPVTLIKLKHFVSDMDEDQTITFSRGREFVYSPIDLASTIQVNNPLKVYSTGEVMSDIKFTEDMKGSITFGAVATDKADHTAETILNVLIVNPDNIASFKVSRTLQDVEFSIQEFKSIFKSHTKWNISVISIKENAKDSGHSDIEIFVIPNSEELMMGQEIFDQVNSNSALMSALLRYGLVDSKPGPTSSSTDEVDKPSNNTVTIIIVIAVVLLVVVILVLALCYVMRNKYKRKLKAAHAMAFDTHTLGFEIDQADTAQTVEEPPSPTKTLNTGNAPMWNHDPDLNNFDWGNSNNAFERHKFYRQSRESHRSSHSVDDNAIDPLNEADTQSCSSAGSNDWRLDLRGNNLDCSPPPPVTDDVIEAILNEHNNQLNCETKFTDSSSDRSSSNNLTKETNTHFDRIISNDSVYGKIYETRRMPNGLETTEV